MATPAAHRIRVVAGFAAALGTLTAPAHFSHAQTGAWQAHEDVSLILEARIGNCKLVGDTGDYFTDLVQVLDCRSGSTKSRAAQLAGCSAKTAR
jgi:hypothetical protein